MKKETKLDLIADLFGRACLLVCSGIGLYQGDELLFWAPLIILNVRTVGDHVRSDG